MKQNERIEKLEERVKELERQLRMYFPHVYHGWETRRPTVGEAIEIIARHLQLEVDWQTEKPGNWFVVEKD